MPMLLLIIQLIHLQPSQAEVPAICSGSFCDLTIKAQWANTGRQCSRQTNPTVTWSCPDVLHALPAGCLGAALPFLAAELSCCLCCCLLQVEKAGDVIAFYNQVFVPEVKPSLMRLHQARATLPRAPTLSITNPFTSPVRVQSRLEFPTNGFSTPPPANRWACPLMCKLHICSAEIVYELCLR